MLQAVEPSIIRTSGLSMTEAGRLKECETVIERGLNTFYEVGSALAEIRDSKLYRAAYLTFEEYCRDRWKMARNYANKLISAAEVVENLGTNVPIPETESQARELSPLEPELQKAVWQIAVETAPKDAKGNPAITAGHIKSVATVVKGIVETGGLDDGTGEVKPLGVLVDAAVTEETYERLMRQKEYVKEHVNERDKSKPHVSHNSGENEWYTPQEFIDAARQVMGAIDLDPASCKAANVMVGAANYYSISNTGLDKAWTGRVWMNPPYASDLVGKFTSKLTHHYLRDEVQEAVVLVNNATDTTWFQDMAKHANAICLLRGRVRFWGPDGQTGAPLQGQVILYFGANKDGFEGSFEQFGLVVWR